MRDPCLGRQSVPMATHKCVVMICPTSIRIVGRVEYYVEVGDKTFLFHGRGKAGGSLTAFGSSAHENSSAASFSLLFPLLFFFCPRASYGLPASFGTYNAVTQDQQREIETARQGAASCYYPWILL